jgi:hypothetical protein
MNRYVSNSRRAIAGPSSPMNRAMSYVYTVEDRDHITRTQLIWDVSNMYNSVSWKGGLQYLLGMLTAGSYRPWVGLGTAHYPIRDIDLRDDLLSQGVLGAQNVDGGEQRRNHGKQTRVGKVSTRADAPAETEASRTRVSDRRVNRAVRGEITSGIECLGVRIILRVVQNSPTHRSVSQ